MLSRQEINKLEYDDILKLIAELESKPEKSLSYDEHKDLVNLRYRKSIIDEHLKLAKKEQEYRDWKKSLKIEINDIFHNYKSSEKYHVTQETLMKMVNESNDEQESKKLVKLTKELCSKKPDKERVSELVSEIDNIMANKRIVEQRSQPKMLFQDHIVSPQEQEKTKQLFQEHINNPNDQKVKQLFENHIISTKDPVAKELFQEHINNPNDVKAAQLFANHIYNPNDQITKQLFQEHINNPNDKKAKVLLDTYIANQNDPKTKQLFQEHIYNPNDQKVKQLFEDHIIQLNPKENKKLFSGNSKNDSNSKSPVVQKLKEAIKDEYKIDLDTPMDMFIENSIPIEKARHQVYTVVIVLKGLIMLTLTFLACIYSNIWFSFTGLYPVFLGLICWMLNKKKYRYIKTWTIIFIFCEILIISLVGWLGSMYYLFFGIVLLLNIPFYFKRFTRNKNKKAKKNKKANPS